MNYKNLEWHIPSIIGLYNLKIQDIDKGYRESNGYWNGSGFDLVKDELNSQEFIEYYHYSEVYKND
jgi:hypothetical protein